MEEVSPDNATAQRSQTTGKLLVTMPKAKPVVKSTKSAMTSSKVGSVDHVTVGVGGASSRKDSEEGKKSAVSKTEGGLLEVDPNLHSKRAELANIMGQSPTPLKGDSLKFGRDKEPSPSPDFVDDPDVPPLI